MVCRFVWLFVYVFVSLFLIRLSQVMSLIPPPLTWLECLSRFSRIDIITLDYLILWILLQTVMLSLAQLAPLRLVGICVLMRLVRVQDNVVLPPPVHSLRVPAPMEIIAHNQAGRCLAQVLTFVREVKLMWINVAAATSITSSKPSPRTLLVLILWVSGSRLIQQVLVGTWLQVLIVLPAHCS